MAYERFSNLRALDSMTEAMDYAVVGPTDSRIHEIHTTRFPFNTVCHVERDFGDGIWRGCSGVLIGPRKVLTAAHCVFSPTFGRAPQRIRITPGRADRETVPYGRMIAREAYAARRFVEAPNNRHPDRRDFDYGLVVLPRPFARLDRFMPVAVASEELFRSIGAGPMITIAGYPGDRPVGTMWRHSERLKKVTPRRLLYTVDTCPGHSGSPIWTRGKQDGKVLIIGVHTSGILDEQGRPYGCGKGVVLAPTGLSNSGVRIIPEIRAALADPQMRDKGKKVMSRVL